MGHLPEEDVSLANGTAIESKGHGCVAQKGSDPPLQLIDCLHIPSLAQNLIICLTCAKEDVNFSILEKTCLKFKSIEVNFLEKKFKMVYLC